MDHLALTYITKSKTEPDSVTNKRLLEVISAFLNNLYDIKGKDIKLGNFLSRIKVDKSNPHDIIPVSFDLQEMLLGKVLYSYNVVITVGKVHGHDKLYIVMINIYSLKYETTKAAKILHHLPSRTPIKQPQLVKNNIP